MLKMRWAALLVLLGSAQMAAGSNAKLRTHFRSEEGSNVDQNLGSCDIKYTARSAVESDALNQGADQSIVPWDLVGNEGNLILPKPAGESHEQSLREEAEFVDEPSQSRSSQTDERDCAQYPIIGPVDDKGDDDIGEELGVVLEEDEAEYYDSNLKGMVIGILGSIVLLFYHLYAAEWLLGYQPEYNF